MADLTAKKVSKLIEEFRQTGKEPEKLVIGYKTYARLMADDKFAEKVVPSLELSLIHISEPTRHSDGSGMAC
ncbi:hypothetical protein, partial [Acinetobacter baumannii]|uniref:hypothetical protein n=1 Tax=Acinetobacter baumannii TaxID=470 RepID=UPI003AFAFFDD